MITDAERAQLFGARDLKQEMQARLDRKEFPPGLVSSRPFDVDAILKEYEELKRDFIKKPTAFENQVVSAALGFSKTFIADNGNDYWPLSLSDYSNEAWEIQRRLDRERGMSWQEHQASLSVARRIVSLNELNKDYDPLIDERLCNNFDPRLKGTYILRLISELKARPTRTRFIFLKPGDRVSLHADYDPTYSIRMHFPLVTNELCFNGYQLGGQIFRFHMVPGRRYIVNNGIPHFAENLGTTGRLHLIVSLDGQEDYLQFQDEWQLPEIEKLETQTLHESKSSISPLSGP